MVSIGRPVSADACRVDRANSFRVEPSGRHAVDPDRRDLADEALDQADQPGAQDVRGDQARDGLADGRGQDDHDGRIAPCAQVGQGLADQPDRAQQRSCDRPVPGRLIERGEGSLGRAAGVDQEPVETAQRLDRQADGGRRSVRGRQVGRDGDAGQRSERIGQRRAVASGARDAGALRGQGARGRRSESMACAADQEPMRREL